METLETKCKLLHFLCNQSDALGFLYLIFYIITMRMFFEGIPFAH